MSTKTKPKAAGKKPPLDERWAEIDKRAKPSKAASTDKTRPVLRNGYIDHRKNGSFLSVTDSYVLVELPITFDCPQRERKKQLPEVGIIPAALKALDQSATGRFRIKDGLVEIEGNPALYPVVADAKPPKFKELWPEDFNKEESGEVGHIGFNPKLLHRAAEAMGVQGRGDNHAVKARFIGPLRPMLIEGLSLKGARGLVLPVRVGV